MKTKSIKITTHARFIIEAEQVKEYVMQLTGMNDLQYKTHLYEMGLAFLQMIYPIEDRKFLTYHIFLESEKTYWKWFRNEWHLFEQDLIQYVLDHKINISHKMWHKEMIKLLHCPRFRTSFYNSLQLFYKNLNFNPIQPSKN